MSLNKNYATPNPEVYAELQRLANLGPFNPPIERPDHDPDRQGKPMAKSCVPAQAPNGRPLLGLPAPAPTARPCPQ